MDIDPIPNYIPPTAVVLEVNAASEDEFIVASEEYETEAEPASMIDDAPDDEMGSEVENEIKEENSKENSGHQVVYISRCHEAKSLVPLFEEFQRNPSLFFHNASEAYDVLIDAERRNQELMNEIRELRSELALYHGRNFSKTHAFSGESIYDETAQKTKSEVTGLQDTANPVGIRDENNNVQNSAPAVPAEFKFPTITLRIELVGANIAVPVGVETAQIRVLEQGAERVEPITLNISQIVSSPAESQDFEVAVKRPGVKPVPEDSAKRSEVEPAPEDSAKRSKVEPAPKDSPSLKEFSESYLKSEVDIPDKWSIEVVNPEIKIEATAPTEDTIGQPCKEVTFDTHQPTMIEPEKQMSSTSVHYPDLSLEQHIVQDPTPEPASPPPIKNSSTGIVRQVPSLTVGKCKSKHSKKEKKPSMLKSMWSTSGKTGSGIPVSAPTTGHQSSKKVHLKKKSTGKGTVSPVIPQCENSGENTPTNSNHFAD